MVTLAKTTGLLMTIGLLGGFAVGWASQPTGWVITVCPQGPPACQFSTVREAINAAVDGTLILLSPGIYLEREELNISKNINLLGPESQSVLLITDQLSVLGLAQVVISGLSITGEVRVHESQATLTNVDVVGTVGVNTIQTETEQPKPSRITLIDVRVLADTSPIPFALSIGPSAEARVIRSEFVGSYAEVIGVLGQLVMSHSLVRGLGQTATGLVAGSGAQVWLSDTQIEVPITTEGLNFGGIEAFQGSNLSLQRVRIFSAGHGVLAQSARLHLEESQLVATNGWGLALMIEACGINSPPNQPPPQRYEGLITGRQNKITGSRGDVCPSALEFLKTAEGGQYP